MSSTTSFSRRSFTSDEEDEELLEETDKKSNLDATSSSFLMSSSPLVPPEGAASGGKESSFSYHLNARPENLDFERENQLQLPYKNKTLCDLSPLLNYPTKPLQIDDPSSVEKEKEDDPHTEETSIDDVLNSLLDLPQQESRSKFVPTKRRSLKKDIPTLPVQVEEDPSAVELLAEEPNKKNELEKKSSLKECKNSMCFI